jgi:hypothetical protein
MWTGIPSFHSAAGAGPALASGPFGSAVSEYGQTVGQLRRLRRHSEASLGTKLVALGVWAVAIGVFVVFVR